MHTGLVKRVPQRQRDEINKSTSETEGQDS